MQATEQRLHEDLPMHYVIPAAVIAHGAQSLNEVSHQTDREKGDLHSGNAG